MKIAILPNEDKVELYIDDDMVLECYSHENVQLIADIIRKDVGAPDLSENMPVSYTQEDYERFKQKRTEIKQRHKFEAAIEQRAIQKLQTIYQGSVAIAVWHSIKKVVYQTVEENVNSFEDEVSDEILYVTLCRAIIKSIGRQIDPFDLIRRY